MGVKDFVKNIKKSIDRSNQERRYKRAKKARLNELVTASREHRRLGMLKVCVPGLDSDGVFRGSSIDCLGCGIRRNFKPKEIAISDHYLYPVWLLLFQDRVFRGLPEAARADWHVELAEAIADADIENWHIAKSIILVRMLSLIDLSSEFAKAALVALSDLHAKVLAGKIVAEEEWAEVNEYCRAETDYVYADGYGSFRKAYRHAVRACVAAYSYISRDVYTMDGATFCIDAYDYSRFEDINCDINYAVAIEEGRVNHVPEKAPKWEQAAKIILATIRAEKARDYDANKFRAAS